MANQNGGWPLGLRPLNTRVGLMRSRDFSAGSVSFSTVVTSPTSFTDSSSDLDTESITLGSLIGVSSIFDLSRRSSRGRRTVEASKGKRIYKTKHWLFSFCSKLSPEALNVSNNNAPSLGHFLEAERRATTNIIRRNHGRPIEFGPDNFSQALPVSDANRLFVNVAAGQASESAYHGRTSSNREFIEYGNGCRTPLLVSCLCGQLIK